MNTSSSVNREDMHQQTTRISSKAEDIALRLWKLKASSLELSNIEFSAFNYLKETSDTNDTTTSEKSDSDDIKPSSKATLLKQNDSNSSDNEKQKNSSDLKPTQSYIALIATAILKSKEKRLVLSDIYKHILENYSYFQSQDKSWRNSIRHNLSLNECFIKVGRSEQGKGHYWAIHPANFEDFSQGDFRRRRARRRVRRSFLDNHPYTGYPLRPYPNTPRVSRPAAEFYNKDPGEFRRKIYPVFYESEFYTPHSKYGLENSSWRRKVVLPYSQEGNTTEIRHQHDVIMKIPPSLIKMNSPTSSTTPNNISCFSIDSILGNKTSPATYCCTSPSCNQRTSKPTTEAQEMPHYL